MFEQLDVAGIPQPGLARRLVDQRLAAVHGIEERHEAGNRLPRVENREAERHDPGVTAPTENLRAKGGELLPGHRLLGQIQFEAAQQPPVGQHRPDPKGHRQGVDLHATAVVCGSVDQAAVQGRSHVEHIGEIVEREQGPPFRIIGDIVRAQHGRVAPPHHLGNRRRHRRVGRHRQRLDVDPGIEMCEALQHDTHGDGILSNVPVDHRNLVRIGNRGLSQHDRSDAALATNQAISLEHLQRSAERMAVNAKFLGQRPLAGQLGVRFVEPFLQASQQFSVSHLILAHVPVPTFNACTDKCLYRYNTSSPAKVKVL